MTDETGAGVRDVAAEHRFVIEQDGELAELVYAIEPGRLILVHTGVPEALGGHGIGGRLVRAAVARARAEGATVVPWCPFARRWLSDHPDVAASVPIDWETPPPDPPDTIGDPTAKTTTARGSS